MQVASNTGFLRRYIFSSDHKTIGVQYIFLALAAVLAGTALSLLMRIHVVWPQARIPLLGEIKPENYLGYLTMHGTLMVFFVLSTAPQSGFGNYFLPLQLGASEMTFPRLSMAGFWLTFVSFITMLAAFFAPGGASQSGWTQYAPLSAVPASGPGEGRGTDLWLVSVAIFCLATMLTSFNFIVTTLRQRAPGMKWMRMPLTCWSWFAAALLSLPAFAVLLAAGVMLLLDRNAGTSFFVPAGLVVSGTAVAHAGGQPLMWQHLFWFFGHPEVYIAILPGMGVTSHMLSVFSRKPVFGYKAMVWAIGAICVMGLGVWGHHMFVSGMNPYAGFAFSALTTAIAVPSAVKTFNWIGTVWGGQVRFTAPLLFSVGFVSLFISGGLTGPMLAQPALNLYLHDTYFVVGHFHLIMAMAGMFGLFAAVYFWFPKIFGRMMDERMAALHFWITFLGAYAIFMPMHLLGLAGHPRRYSELSGVQYLGALAPVQKFITVAAVITIAGQLVFLVNFFRSMVKGRVAGPNPWSCTTLEWVLPSPAPREGFGGNPPRVNHGPYEYDAAADSADFVMQNASAN